MKRPSSLKRVWIWLWVGLLTAWFLWTIDPVHLRCARVKAHSAICQNNLKSLALALRRYAEAHDNRLPPADRWMDTIKPYVGNSQVFRCPHTPAAHLKYSYGFNVHLSGASDNDITDHSKTVLLYEAASGLPNAHDDPSRLRFIDWDRQYVHGQSSWWANFAFADGHVQGFNFRYYEDSLDNGRIRVKK